MSVILSPDYRRRLREFWKAHENFLHTRIGIAALKTAIGAPFTWQTLDRALRGQPVSESTRDFIVGWLNTYAYEPKRGQHRDFKRAASNDSEEAEASTATQRGSR